MSACDECRNDFDAMSRLVESLPDDMKTSNCVLNAKMLLVAFAYQKAEKENAKLRELVRGLLTGYECGRDELCEGCTWTGMEDPHEFRCPARVKARELGVEVDR